MKTLRIPKILTTLYIAIILFAFRGILGKEPLNTLQLILLLLPNFSGWIILVLDFVKSDDWKTKGDAFKVFRLLAIFFNFVTSSFLLLHFGLHDMSSRYLTAAGVALLCGLVFLILQAHIRYKDEG